MRPEEELLICALAAAVPMEIEDLRWADETARRNIAARLRYQPPGSAPSPLEHGDQLLYGGPQCAPAFTALAQALALLACKPGGVTFGPLRWCAAHMHQRWAEPDGIVCPACLHSEHLAGGRPG
jgi:hypothetical protein